MSLDQTNFEYRVKQAKEIECSRAIFLVDSTIPRSAEASFSEQQFVSRIGLSAAHGEREAIANQSQPDNCPFVTQHTS